MDTKVLVVVDMQNDFVTGALRNEEAIKITPKVAEYIENYRKENGENCKVIFTRDSHFEDYLNSPEGKKLPVEHCLLNSKGWQIVDDINVRPTDLIVNKPTFGFDGWKRVIAAAANMIIKPQNENEAFSEDNLGTGLIIDIVGVCTDICVVSNALLLKTFFPHAEINIHKDLCAGVTPGSHDAALRTMEACQCNIV